MLQDRHVALAITGSIAAYKAADLASKLTQEGALVDVLMTASATRFITPLTLRSLTRRPVFIDMFDPNTEFAEEHVEIARGADVAHAAEIIRVVGQQRTAGSDAQVRSTLANHLVPALYHQ